MGKVAGPELTLNIGTRVQCAQRRDTWVFMGYRKSTVSTGLYFINVDGYLSSASLMYNAVHAETLERKFPGITEISKTQAQVRKILDVSTAHVSPETACMLDRAVGESKGTPGVLAFEKRDYGWMVHVSDEPEKGTGWGSLPEELQNLILLARRMDCDWIMFDRDGVTLDHMPVWEWS